MAALLAVAVVHQARPKARLLALPKVLGEHWVHLQLLGQQHSQGHLQAGSQVAVPSRPMGQT